VKSEKNRTGQYQASSDKGMGKSPMLASIKRPRDGGQLLLKKVAFLKGDAL